jgi:hypothetical protein
LFNAPKKINGVFSSASIIPNLCDSVIASFTFADGLHATIHCDMLFAEKKREIVITGDQGILVWDEICENKLKFYPYRAQYHSDIKKITYQQEEPVIINIEQYDALSNEINELSNFLNNNKSVNFQDSIATLEVINLLESVESRLTEGRLCSTVI